MQNLIDSSVSLMRGDEVKFCTKRNSDTATPYNIVAGFY